MGYGNETSEHRMGYGGVGMYHTPAYSGTKVQNYQPSHEVNQNSHTLQPPVTTNFSRDDTAPIPYPPQHPHTLHPNHTLPAPLHHITTGHYSPGHSAIYPSHLTYTNTAHVHTHQQLQYDHQRQHYSNQLHPVHQQQQPPQQVYGNHHQHYVQPVARHPGGNLQPVQQYGMTSPQRGPDSIPVHVVDPHHVKNVVTHPAAVPLTGVISNPPPRMAFPAVVPGQLSPQVRYRMAAVPNQYPPHYYHIHSHHTTAHTAAVPVHVATAQQPPPSAPPAAGATQDHLHQTHSVQPKKQLYGKFAPQQALQSQYRAFKLGQPVPNQQEDLRSHDNEGIASNMAGLKLEQARVPQHHSPVDVGKDGYRVSLKPAANMVKFKFNMEAILKASNIK